MSPSKISRRVFLDRVAWVDRMVDQVRQLPLLRILAGYRNRLVQYYHEVSSEELYQVCSAQLGDVSLLTAAMRAWVDAHPHMVDASL